MESIGESSPAEDWVWLRKRWEGEAGQRKCGDSETDGRNITMAPSETESRFHGLQNT